MQRTTCRVCAAPLPPPFLDLGAQPPANNLCEKKPHTESSFPLQATQCQDCQLVQLTEVVDPKLLFNTYLYKTGASSFFDQHFDQYARSVNELVKSAFTSNRPVVDIGANDGLLLSKFESLGYSNLVAVEPAINLATELSKRFPVFPSFWNAPIASTIRDHFGLASVITANNVFAHTDDVHGFLEAVKILLADDGAFVFEVVSLAKLIQAGTWDMMLYHEHVSTYGVKAISVLLEKHGFALWRVDDVASHGGSLRCWASPKVATLSCLDRTLLDSRLEREEQACSFENLCVISEKAASVKSTFRRYLQHAKADGLSIAGYGAPAKATVLLNYCEIGPHVIDYIVEDNELKIGKLIPGVHIPIVGVQRLQTNPPDILVIFPWNVADDIIKKLPIFKEIAIPMPELRIIRNGT